MSRLFVGFSGIYVAILTAAGEKPRHLRWSREIGRTAGYTPDMPARLARIANLIREMGLEHVGEPHLRHIEGRLWEIRLKGHSGISRALYVTLAVSGS
jgi:hypothetical protein